MDYSKVLEDNILRSNHKFIYGKLSEREKYLKNLEKQCTLKKEGQACLYIDDLGLKECENKNCDKICLSYFNERYFEVTVTIELITKIINELEGKILENIYNELKQFRPFSILKEFNSLEILKKELEKIKYELIEMYQEYIKYEKANVEIFYLPIEKLIKNLKKILPNLKKLNLLINKKGIYSNNYIEVINKYINARSTENLIISVGCEDKDDWNHYYDLNGHHIQYVHDYSLVEMYDWKLTKK